MKLIKFLIFSFFILGQIQAKDSFVEANSAYGEGDYLTAVKLYNEILKEKQSAAVYFNLGKTYWNLKDNGMAVYCFKKALSLDNSSDTRKAFDFLISQIGFEEYGKRNFLTRFLDLISFNFFTWLVFVSFWCACIAFCLFLAKKNLHKLVFFFVFTFFFSFCFMGLLLKNGQLKEAVVLENAELKFSPTDNSPSRLDLKAGAICKVIEKKGKYFFVELQDDEGWVDLGKVAKIY